MQRESVPYRPLNKSTSQLHGDLRIVSLESEPPYEALSYTWGSSSESKTMQIDKRHSINITDNLFRALRRMRGHLLSRTLWIDAVCINQDDGSEKSSQVQMMGRIYKSATTVLVWLGEYSHPSPSDPWRMRRPHWKDARNSAGLNDRGRRFAVALNEALRDTEPRWHDRAWIIQEFVLSTETLLCFGPITIAYDKLHLMDLMLRLPQHLEYLDAFFQKTSDMVKLSYGVGELQQSISEACLYTSTASCKDDRDRVYSLLSLIDVKEAAIIGADYTESCPCEITFARATYAALVARNDFSILQLVSFKQLSAYSLPSWVVDFTLQQDPTDGQVHRHVTRPVKWPLDGTDDGSSPLTVSLNMKLLMVTGTAFDSVDEVLSLATARFAQTGASAAKIAEDLIPFLLKLFQKRDSRPVWVKCSESLDDLLKPGVLLMAGSRTQAGSIIKASFTVWHDVASPAAIGRDAAYVPFWRCGSDEKYQRTSDIVGTELGWLMDYAAVSSGGANVFTTSTGLIGLAPSTVEPTDRIVLLKNGKLPALLQAVGEHYLFRGFAWVHNANEEVQEKSQDGMLKADSFVLC
ncbi:hypothetical protein LTR37_004994 [Vermiconidia calcicola]|uniref:Uncharacterized protein n=1 Tax=Vermiconidia calcicola TaxID=1690605 RepID=A0ACC3NL84_9PEZI|nr:hypothetical protein LTR37_004994 [Vermiconidia calcicola]